jgi:hypothetical protein
MKRQPSSATHEAKFADKLGYHRTHVGGLERGERNLTLKAVERIASRLKLVDGHPRTGPAAHRPVRLRRTNGACHCAANLGPLLPCGHLAHFVPTLLQGVEHRSRQRVVTVGAEDDAHRPNL